MRTATIDSKDESAHLDQETIRQMKLDLLITDQDVIVALQAYSGQDERSCFALAALKIGILAIRQASGTIDSRTIQQEADTLLRDLRTSLNEQSGQIRTTLGQYFDPSSGQFNQRIDRLVGRDGDLEKAIASHLTGENSALRRILTDNLGENSPLLQRFSLDERAGIIAAISKNLQAVLDLHANSSVEQFSLDKPDSAISRMLSTLTEKNGRLREDLAGDLEKVRGEFSLDKENSALNRLMGQIIAANDKIKKEFSLDNQESALSRLSRLLESTKGTINDNLSIDKTDSPLNRLRNELTGLLTKMEKGQLEFQQKVGETLSAMNARREESRRSTAHGSTFEFQLGKYLEDLTKGLGDQLSHVGSSVGAVSRCKVGDFVITLSDTSAAPGAKLVVEAKEDKSYSLEEAFNEIEQARQNREADAGIFVFSSKIAPAGMQPIERKGRDLIVRWDADDVNTDIVLQTTVLVSRFLVVQRKRDDSQNQVEIQKMNKSVDALVRGITHLDTIITSGTTVQNGAQKILAEAGKAKKLHEEELAMLKDFLTTIGTVGIANN